MLKGKGDRDSGHCDMSDANSDIETVVSTVSHNSEPDPRVPERISRSNSDFAAPLSQREKAVLKDKVTRSRSIDPTKIQVSSLYGIFCPYSEHKMGVCKVWFDIL